MKKTAVIAAFAAGAQAQSSCGGMPVFSGYQPYMDKECKTKIPMPEDALKQTLDALNQGLGVLADQCMPAPDGKGAIMGVCSKDGYNLNYYLDPKCPSNGVKEMPKEISEAMKGQTSFPYDQCVFQGNQGGMDIYGMYWRNVNDTTKMEGGDDKKDDPKKEEDWKKEEAMKEEDMKKEEAMKEDDKKKEEAMEKEDPKKAEDMKEQDMKKEEAMKEEDRKKEEAMKEDDMKKEENGKDEKKYKIEGDGYEVMVNMEDGVEVQAKIEDNEINVKVDDDIDVQVNMMDDYDIKVKTSEGKNGGSEMTTEMKFDNYYMYGIDSMGGKGNSAPICGPGSDQCAKISNSTDSCCTHVLMTDEGNGEQTSMYRCMNQRIIDGASFSIAINGMQVAMQCSKSGSNYLTKAFAASAAAFVASTLF